MKQFLLVFGLVLIFVCPVMAQREEILSWSNTIAATDTAKVCTSAFTIGKLYNVYGPNGKYPYQSIWRSLYLGATDSTMAAKTCSVEVQWLSWDGYTVAKLDSAKWKSPVADSLVKLGTRMRPDTAWFKYANTYYAQWRAWYILTDADTVNVGKTFTGKVKILITERY